MLRFTEKAGFLRTIRRCEVGQTMVEYGVTLTVICVATVAVFTALGGGIANSVEKVVGLLP